MHKVNVTIEGNLTADPELRYTPSGIAVANFSIAVTERVSDGNGGFKDGDTSFYRIAAWRQLAEHIAASLSKGQAVIVHGTLKVEEFERKDGSKGNSAAVTADAVGPSLRFGTTVFTKSQGGQAGNAQAQQPAQQYVQQQAPTQQQYVQQQAPAQQQQYVQQAPAQQYAQQPQFDPNAAPQQPTYAAAPAGQPAQVPSADSIGF